jgi:hypothetical protein
MDQDDDVADVGFPEEKTELEAPIKAVKGRKLWRAPISS